MAAGSSSTAGCGPTAAPRPPCSAELPDDRGGLNHHVVEPDLGATGVGMWARLDREHVRSRGQTVAAPAAVLRRTGDGHCDVASLVPIDRDARSPTVRVADEVHVCSRAIETQPEPAPRLGQDEPRLRWAATTLGRLTDDGPC